MVTRSTSFEDTAEFYKGHKAESVIAHILRQEGYFVHITADLQERGRNGAPGSRSDDSFITLPDLDVAKRGYRGFVEVKYKTTPSITNLTNRPEHGVSLPQFRMYWRAQKEFGTCVFLFIYEGLSGAVLYSPLSLLVRDGFFEERISGVMSLIKLNDFDEPIARIYRGNKMGPGGMVFFPRSAFDLWGKVALVGETIYKQLSFVEEGENIFKVIKHKNGLQYPG